MFFPDRRIAGISGVILLFTVHLLSSCSWSRETSFTFYNAENDTVILKADSRKAAIGRLQSDKTELFSYRTEQQLTVPDFYSLEFKYTIESTEDVPDAQDQMRFVLRIPDGQAWVLPHNIEFLGLNKPYTSISYSVPVQQSVFSEFTLSIEPKDSEARQEDKTDTGSSDYVHSINMIHIKLVPRFFGYAYSDDTVRLTPYVYPDASTIEPGLWINPPESWMNKSELELVVDYSDTERIPEKVFLDVGRSSYEFSPPSAGPLGALHFGPGTSNGSVLPLHIESRYFPQTLLVQGLPERPFPRIPIPAEPAQILSYKQSEWRDERYEVFSWNRFPSVLILDTRDYSVQARMLKRLAFFVEKAEYRGMLMSDEEISHLHGWNAHDYRATDLAAFFETARKTNFPLLAEERELQAILLANGILKQSNTDEFSAGTGALVSISRESTEGLRSLFLVHEGYHGLFFIDEDFRSFAQYRWDSLNDDAKTFIRAYFDYLKYDTSDDYLMKNELMAYSLQQHPSQADRYFGSVLPGRLKNRIEYAEALAPFSEEEGSWHELGQLFTEEASAFSRYVRQRWGFTGGRIWQLYQSSRSNESR